MFDFGELVNSTIEKIDSSPTMHFVFNNPLLVGLIIVAGVIAIAYFIIEIEGNITKFAIYSAITSISVVFLHHKISKIADRKASADQMLDAIVEEKPLLGGSDDDAMNINVSPNVEQYILKQPTVADMFEQPLPLPPGG
jgi:hypothetical protein